MNLLLAAASMPHTMGVTKILLLPLGFSILFLAIALYGLQMRRRDENDNRVNYTTMNRHASRNNAYLIPVKAYQRCHLLTNARPARKSAL